jgi:hypothetical protein
MVKQRLENCEKDGKCIPSLRPYLNLIGLECTLARLSSCKEMARGQGILYSQIAFATQKKGFALMSAIRCGLISLAWLLCPILCFSQLPNANFNRLTAYRFVYFQVPGAAMTNPTSINDSLSVAGTYGSAEGLTGGFVRTADGRITTFDVGQVYTGELQINAVGEIAGVYQDVSGDSRGFTRSANGSITKFNPGGPTGFTDVRAINSRGTVVGIYSTTNSTPPAQAYVRARSGALTTFTIPGCDYVFPWGINDLGEVTGVYYYDNDTQVGGFVRSPGGIITTFTYAAGIVPLAINLAGTTIGWYGPPTGSFDGFVRAADGVINPFSVPGGLSTQFMGFNEAGFVAGSYSIMNTQNPMAPAEQMYGFVRSPTGVISSFEVPGASETIPTGINNLNVVVGWSDNQGGFLHIPDAVPF